jgi:hypothetical protein
MLVTADGFASGGVDHGHSKVFIVDTDCGLGSQFLEDEMSRWQKIVNQELVDSFLDDQATVADLLCWTLSGSLRKIQWVYRLLA